jgi:hypothetical protein
MFLSKDFIIHNIDNKLHKDFKTACSHYDVSMRYTLIQHMRNIVEDYKNAIVGRIANFANREEKDKK